MHCLNWNCEFIVNLSLLKFLFQISNQQEKFIQIKLVDIYQILTHVVGVKPQANNGTWEDIRELLVNANKAESTAFGFLKFVMTILITVNNSIIRFL